MRKLKVWGISITFALILGVATFLYLNQEEWPTPNGVEYSALGQEKAEQFRSKKISPSPRMQDQYSLEGDYLNYGATVHHRPSEKIQLDNDGLPMIKSGKSYWYNPVTLSQFVLASYGRYLKDGVLEPVIAGSNKLLDIQRADGAFPYQFPYRHYSMVAPYAKDWISGMAQGVALSALARAYLATNDQRYLDAGNKSLDFLGLPKGMGGPKTDLSDLDPSLKDYVFFLEYQTEPNVYTLNGFMFTLMGLYDWGELTDSKTAEKLFEDGMDTLEKILIYYDLGKFSSYDLSYITHVRPPYLVPIKPHISPSYHAVHITQLQALHSVYPSKTLQEFRDRWIKYVEPPNR